MIVRLILIIALVSLVIMAYRKITAAKNNSPKAPDAASMRKCAQCGIHLPESEAKQQGSHFFCSDEHRIAYMNNHPDD